MKRTFILLLPVIALALAAPVWAGGACEGTAEECLSYMKTHFENKGWVGVSLDESTGHLTVTEVVEDSPAAKAGFEVGDIFHALNGVEYSEENKEKMAELQSEMTVGNTFTFTLMRNEKKHDLEVTLASMPEKIMYQAVGAHMLQGHATAAKAEEE